MTSQNKATKSDQRIANNNNYILPSNQFIISRNRARFIRNYNNQNNHNNLNNNNNNNTQNNNSTSLNQNTITITPPPIYCVNNRFASIPSSPTIEDTSNTISFGSLNVRSIHNPTKFDLILHDLFDESISIIALQETRISDSSAQHQLKNYWSSYNLPPSYTARWDYDSRDSHSGVGLLIKDHLSKYIQKVHKHKGRFIAIDLYFPTRKIKIINIYCTPQDNYNNNGKLIIEHTVNHIKQAEKDNFNCFILGDFNADPYHYHDALSKGRTIPKYLSLIKFLDEHNYIEQHPTVNNGLTFATFYRNHIPTS
jgi:exonuclease III